MRLLLTAILLGLYLSGCGSAPAPDERFSLRVNLIRTKNANAPLRIAFELRNISVQPQVIFSLTDLFEGDVYLRDVKGKVHHFIQTNYLHMMLTSLWTTPSIEIAPGGSFRWEHSLLEFVEPDQIDFVHAGNQTAVTYPILAAGFRPGCEIWCTLNISQSKKIDETHSTGELTAIVTSNSLVSKK
jgi:hypothetical protein